MGILFLIGIVLDFWGSSALGNILVGSSLTLCATFITATAGNGRARLPGDRARSRLIFVRLMPVMHRHRHRHGLW